MHWKCVCKASQRLASVRGRAGRMGEGQRHVWSRSLPMNCYATTMGSVYERLGETEVAAEAGEADVMQCYRLSRLPSMSILISARNGQMGLSLLVGRQTHESRAAQIGVLVLRAKHDLAPPRCRLATGNPSDVSPFCASLRSALEGWGTDQTLPHPLPIPSLP